MTAQRAFLGLGSNLGDRRTQLRRAISAVPDLVAVLPSGITAAQVSAIGGLTGVRAVLAVAGGRMTVDGRAVSVLGVPPAFRSWTPPATAADAGIWARLSGGQLISSGAAPDRCQR